MDIARTICAIAALRSTLALVAMFAPTPNPSRIVGLIGAVPAIGLLLGAACAQFQSSKASEYDRARRGCRSPTEPGCETCCEASPPSAPDRVCLVWTKATDRAESGGERFETGIAAEPWRYRVREVLVNCPASCAPCARCKMMDEYGLRRARACDCDHTKHEADADCFYPDGCGCQCWRRRTWLKRCPPSEE